MFAFFHTTLFPIVVFSIAVIAPLMALGLSRLFLRTDASAQAKRAHYRHVSWGMLVAIAGALIGVYFSWQNDAIEASAVLLSFNRAPAIEIGILIDRLSTLMLCLVSIIGFVVVRFSERYLDRERGQRRFLFWLATTATLTQMLIVSSNLLQFLLLWIAVYASTDQLIRFYRDRPLAYLCARQRQLVSRLGDIALLTGAILLNQLFFTLDFTALNQLGQTMLFTAAPMPIPPLLTTATALLCLGICAKSAQFPFHTWLPTSVETPTPVSALMHAGVINAGIFLMLRLNVLFACTPYVIYGVALIGALTALFGMSAMVTQTSIKRRLAYSTVGQTGFTTMLAALGLTSVAFLHLLAHGFYKAYAYLRAGSALDQAREQDFFPHRFPHAPLPAALFTVAVAGILFLLHNSVFAERSIVASNHLPLLVVWVLFSAHLMWGAFSIVHRRLLAVSVGCLLLISLATLYVVLTELSHWALSSQHVEIPVLIPWWLAILLSVPFVIGFLLQMFGKSFTKTAIGHRIHLHLHNGLYIEPVMVRMIGRFTLRNRLAQIPQRRAQLTSGESAQ